MEKIVEKSTFSKPLGTEDVSGASFAIEMLAGDPTFGINFDRVQWDSQEEGYVIIELLLCDEKQFPRGITPYTSHPNRYFKQNAKKFTSLWELTQKLEGQLYLVNYSKRGTDHQNEILLMKVLNIDEDEIKVPVTTEDTRFNRSEFSQWFRALNLRGA